MFYLAVLLVAFLGAFSGVAAFHYGRHRLAVRQIVQKPHLEVRTDGRVCTSCRSHVHRYEELPNNHIMCANCVQDRKNAQRSA